jgi:hypothetical protein
LIGTIATGVLGMNVFDFTQRGALPNLLLFVVVLGATMVVAAVTVAKSKRLADFLDELSDERVGWKSRVLTLRRVFGRLPQGRS